ncbi:MAG TPA: tRNA uridine(34) 5-carboxymethylaminomethyl modification radical SAM/GNAT enzyme Elp3 [Candidatus Aenigmarchaeota archaeon]|nr:tRNA uridine(34) 5-carboxymethylaminomethyl modification radical SAM/GNAT enzyme Elp3 [Candidatus Aenigmarchaeota archaeon]
MERKEKVCREVIENLLRERKLSEKVFMKVLKEVAKKYRLEKLPTKIEILSFCTPAEKSRLKKVLTTKPSRTISGVTVVTVVAKPAPCPGSCLYCPRGINAPQSYTGLEPAIQRAIRNDYDPFLQTKDRLNQYKVMGHPSDKIEVIILGGTFTALSEGYQEWFVKRIFDALNGVDSETLEEAQRINETAKHRCVGLTIETRPDFCKEKHVDFMLRLGATRVEIGVQSIYDDVLKFIKRGHTVEDEVEAIRIARDAGYKIVLHVMPGLPGSDFKRDIKMFKTLFSDQRFMPDGLKIYPTMVIEGTELYEMWKRGEYNPLDDEKTIKLLVEIKKLVPPFVRIRRVLRDIPATKIVAGPKKSNIRELVQKRMKEIGLRCRCIRCREVGHMEMNFGLKPRVEDIKLVRREYKASGGVEIFLSFEDVKRDILIAFLRLRIPSGKAHRKEIKEVDSAIIREIHTYGYALEIGKKPKEEWQHRGYGKELIEEAEDIAKIEFDKKKMVVISGVGVRRYFMKNGYKRDGLYVSKLLK